MPQARIPGQPTPKQPMYPEPTRPPNQAIDTQARLNALRNRLPKQVVLPPKPPPYGKPNPSLLDPTPGIRPPGVRPGVQPPLRDPRSPTYR